MACYSSSVPKQTIAWLLLLLALAQTRRVPAKLHLPPYSPQVLLTPHYCFVPITRLLHRR